MNRDDRAGDGLLIGDDSSHSVLPLGGVKGVAVVSVFIHAEMQLPK